MRMRRHDAQRAARLQAGAGGAHRALIACTSLMALLALAPPRARAQEARTALPQGPIAPVADTARGGMVVAARAEAAAIGAAVLRAGGNAADAAVATHFALAVCYPFAGNVGGGGFAVVRPARGRVQTLDFRERAPRRAHARLLLDSAGRYSAARALESHLAVGVPGSVAGMAALHRRYGRLSWARLVQPAIDLARGGYVASAVDARDLGDSAYRAALRRRNTVVPPLLQGPPLRAGDTLRWPELARTLERIRDGGAAGFYRGPVAELIVAEMRRGGGLIDAQDLAAYRPVWRPPLVGRYAGLTVYAMGPPSSGGLTLLQALALLAPSRRVGQGPLTPPRAHALIEAERRAFAARAEWLGDPDYVRVPLAALLDSAYLQRCWASYDPHRASPSVGLSLPAPAERDETTHLSVADGAGMAVSLTTTLNGAYGTGIVVGGAGFFLNNEMDDFSASPGVPNQFGIRGGLANAIAPGKRPVSSMTPTVVDSAGQLRLVLGSPGGSRIPSAVLNVLLQVADGRQTLPAAVAAPRLHHQWRPDTVRMEPRGAYPAGLADSLRARGHRPLPLGLVGLVNAIERRGDGLLVGVADTRHPDAAARGSDGQDAAERGATQQRGRAAERRRPRGR